MEEIAQFFQSPRLEVIFVIDQMNGLDVLEKSKKDIGCSYEEVYLWLVRCRVRHNAILSASANYGTYLQQSVKQSNLDTIHVYGGLTAVSLSENDDLRRENFLTGSDGNGTVVATEQRR